MNIFKKIFGYRTAKAASGAMPPFTLNGIAASFGHAVMVSHGWNVIPYSVQNTNSMIPIFDSNAILLAELVPYERLREGDIVTYRSARLPLKLIVHRLNERLKNGHWFMVGDGNSRQDDLTLTPENFDRRICGLLYGSKDGRTDT